MFSQMFMEFFQNTHNALKNDIDNIMQIQHKTIIGK